jgi:hypothetical protein
VTDLLDVRIEASAFELRPLRHELSEALRARSIAVPESEVVVVLENELATVAIVAGTGPLTVRVSLDHATVTASVTEQSKGSDPWQFVAPRHASSFRLVAGLADSWGYTCDPVLRLWASSQIEAP